MRVALDVERHSCCPARGRCIATVSPFELIAFARRCELPRFAPAAAHSARASSTSRRWSSTVDLRRMALAEIRVASWAAWFHNVLQGLILGRLDLAAQPRRARSGFRLRLAPASRSASLLRVLAGLLHHARRPSGRRRRIFFCSSAWIRLAASSRACLASSRAAWMFSSRFCSPSSIGPQAYFLRIEQQAQEDDDGPEPRSKRGSKMFDRQSSLPPRRQPERSRRVILASAAPGPSAHDELEPTTIAQLTHGPIPSMRALRQAVAD